MAIFITNVCWNRKLIYDKYCSASSMFVGYHVPDSKAVIRNLVGKFMLRFDVSHNKLVLAIINTDITW